MMTTFMVIAYDELITNVSRSFGVRKALIQSESFWEYWKETPLDNLADGLVLSWYAYSHAYEAWLKVPVGPPPTPPLGGRDDSSTGISQIFGRTAIRARNYAVAQGLISGSMLNADDWHVLVLGYCAIFPLVTAVMTGSYVQAEVWGNQAAPFGSQEAEIGAVIIVIGAILLVGAFVVVNRALRRRLGSRHPAVFWLAAIAVQLVPFAWFMMFTDRTIPVLLGKGMLW